MINSRYGHPRHSIRCAQTGLNRKPLQIQPQAFRQLAPFLKSTLLVAKPSGGKDLHERDSVPGFLSFPA